MTVSTPKVRLCAHPGCNVIVKPGVLACRAHWAALSSDLRDRLVDAWEKRKAHPDVPELVQIHRILLLEAMREWGVTPQMAADAMARAPRVIQTACPWCGMTAPLHRPECEKVQ